MTISVLLVDDDLDRQTILAEKIRQTSVAIDLSVAASVKSARRELKRCRYDLLVIDLVLPLSDNAPLPSRTGGLALLEWLDDEDNKPGYVIGISSFADVADEQAVEFAEKSWFVLRYDTASRLWFDQLRALLQHIEGAKRQTTDLGPQSDILVVTALRKPELQAVLSLDWAFDDVLRPVDGRQFVRTGRKRFSDGREITVAAGSTSKMGLVWTSLFTLNAIKKLRPRVVFMTGICMGHPGETSIGDIVVGVHSWNWQAGRLSAKPDGSAFFEMQPEPVVASKLLSNLWDDLSADNSVTEQIHREYYGKKPAAPAKIRVAPMVSGSLVIAHESVHRDIFEQDRKIRAVDMETFGVYAACESMEELPPLFISVKCVSDLGLPDKGDGFQDYCAFASARAVDIFLNKYWESLGLPGLAGNAEISRNSAPV